MLFDIFSDRFNRIVLWSISGAYLADQLVKGAKNIKAAFAAHKHVFDIVKIIYTVLRIF